MSINAETAHRAEAEASAKRLPAQNVHLLPVDEAFKAFDSSNDGLSLDEAKSRLDRFGPNQLQERQKTSVWMRLLLQFHNPLIYVLFATAEDKKVSEDKKEDKKVSGTDFVISAQNGYRGRDRCCQRPPAQIRT